jgi:hypothetical protein
MKEGVAPLNLLRRFKIPDGKTVRE